MVSCVVLGRLVLDFPVSGLRAWLLAELGLGGEVLVERIAGGQSNPTYFVTVGGRRLVLRKKPAGPVLPSAHAVDREYRVLAALAGSGVPVPEVVAFCDDVGVIGTPFYLMERLEGRVVHDNALPGLAPDERRAVYLSMAGVLARLHGVDFRAVGLEGFGRVGGYLARQIGRWAKQWELSRTREVPDIERLIEWLPAHIPEDERTSIVHGDFRVGNVMLHETEPKVIAVLDWELSTLGHPMADLAHGCMGWHSSPDEFGGLLGLDLEGLVIPTEAEFLQAYAEASGQDLRLLPFHHAFALFRFAVIFEGIAARAKAGNAAAADAAEVGHLSERFAARAIEVIEGGAHKVGRS